MQNKDPLPSVAARAEIHRKKYDQIDVAITIAFSFVAGGICGAFIALVVAGFIT
jgi:hypothetical protein